MEMEMEMERILLFGPIMTKLPFPHFKLVVNVKGNSVWKNDVETI